MNIPVTIVIAYDMQNNSQVFINPNIPLEELHQRLTDIASLVLSKIHEVSHESNNIRPLYNVAVPSDDSSHDRENVPPIRNDSPDQPLDPSPSDASSE